MSYFKTKMHQIRFRLAKGRKGRGVGEEEMGEGRIRHCMPTSRGEREIDAYAYTDYNSYFVIVLRIIFVFRCSLLTNVGLHCTTKFGL